MSYLKPSQVATVLGVSGQTIRTLIYKGELTGVRVGNQLRIDECEVTCFIQANTKEASKDACK